MRFSTALKFVLYGPLQHTYEYEFGQGPHGQSEFTAV
jgi:hypothetical protein